MAYTAGMDVDFRHGLPLQKALAALLNAGWTYDIDGRIHFLSILPASRTDWQVAPVADWQDVLLVLLAKSEDRGDNRIQLRFPQSDILVYFQFFADGDLSVDYGVERPRLTSGGFTRHDWFVDHIVIPLVKAGAEVDVVRCHDVFHAERAARTAIAAG